MDNVYLYIFVMAIVTFAIRALPLTLIRGEIKSKKIRSFLYYVPYATLSAMTFPAILSATSDIRSAAAGLIAALVLAVMKRGLLIVATGACIAVLLVEMLPI
ncbi:MAG: AzlD domain-containing protein [Lachnospiraceae bacterium]|nr:AzlD domain-containing protein [Lachnospiraceae bacterium]MDN4744666.1 AzlD domain-containing protein [Lachnospiraceae bacterium C1.1]